MVDSLWPAILLAAVADFVDALGYVGLAHLFTAHLTGNAAAIGAHLGQGHWTESLLRLTPLPAFVLGGAVGTASVAEPLNDDERTRRRGFGRVYGAIFLAFMLGACGGSFAEIRWGPIALLGPIAALLVVVAEQLWHAARDQHEPPRAPSERPD